MSTEEGIKISSEGVEVKEFQFDDNTLGSQLEEHFGEGLALLIDGYIDYSKDVIINRAIPNLFDGLKPVQRHILNVLKLEKHQKLVKSSTITGKIMMYHPHGDASIYTAMARMTEVNGSMMLPLVHGHGNLGERYSSDAPAAMRYTEVGQIKYLDEYFTTENSITWVQTEDLEHEFPKELPVSFPAALANESNGISVGIATKIPSFRMEDILNLTEEYIENGKIETIIAPDFAGDSYLINNQKEFAKIMLKGKGRLKLKAKLEVSGREVIIRDIPQGVKYQTVLKEINEAEISAVTKVSNYNDKNGMSITVFCRSKADTDRVVHELYKKTSLQINYNANMLFIKDDKPVQVGVYGVIIEWLKWRHNFIVTDAKLQLEYLIDRSKKVRCFIELLSKEDLKDLVVTTATKDSVSKAKDIIVQNIEEADEEVADWIVKRSLSQFNKSNNYKNDYAKMQQEMRQTEEIIEDPNIVVRQDIQRLKQTPGFIKPRNYELTNKDFKYIKPTAEEMAVINKEEAWFTVNEHGFINKYNYQPHASSPDTEIYHGLTNDVIIALDSSGGLHKVYGEELRYSTIGETGIYIPKYSDVRDSEIIWSGIAKKGEKHTLYYSDGYIGFIDMDEFNIDGVNQRSRFMLRGINDNVDKLIDIQPYDPDTYFVMEDVATRKPKLGITRIGNLPIKPRTSRIKAMTVKQPSRYGMFSREELDAQLNVEDFLTTNEDKKIEVYDGQFPEHISEEDLQGREVTGVELSEIASQFDELVNL